MLLHQSSTNLVVTLTNTPNSGLVEIEATALNENYFTIAFDGNDSTIITSATGKLLIIILILVLTILSKSPFRLPELYRMEWCC